MTKKKRYKIINSHGDITIDAFNLNEIKELFKYEVLDAEDKEIVEDFNNEIDNCESIEDILWILKIYRDVDYYEFIEVEENEDNTELEHWQHIQFENGSNSYISKIKSDFEYMQNKYNLVNIKDNFWLAKEK